MISFQGILSSFLWIVIKIVDGVEYVVIKDCRVYCLESWIYHDVSCTNLREECLHEDVAVLLLYIYIPVKNGKVQNGLELEGFLICTMKFYRILIWGVKNNVQ